MASTGSNSRVEQAAVEAAQADIVVGLTSFNDGRTIGAVARAVRDGLSRHFGGRTARIVLADARSSDGTREAAREAVGAGGLDEVEYAVPAALAEMPYHGHPARASAVRAILQAAQRLGARACVVLDGGLAAPPPDWIERLASPILSGEFDYVAPYYARRVNEGAITRGIVYPVFRALYGVRLRQPAAAEFGCSAPLVAHLLAQDLWDAEQAQVAIDLWLAAAAVSAEFRVCEAPLGVRASARDAPADLSTTLAQVVGGLFADADHREELWQRTRRSVAVPVIGSAADAEAAPAPVAVEGLVESFQLGYRELREIWTWVLPPRAIVELRKLTEAPVGRFRFEDALWADIVYDFALGYSLRVMRHDHLLRSLTPLYTGWLASFVIEMADAGPAEVEERVEQLCRGFEAEKRYLIGRWRWPERLR
jgi:hypothetical protein